MSQSYRLVVVFYYRICSGGSAFPPLYVYIVSNLLSATAVKASKCRDGEGCLGGLLGPNEINEGNIRRRVNVRTLRRRHGSTYYSHD